MPLTIIGAGFGRTGTLSVHTALNTLGYPCYHMVEAVSKANHTHMDFWREVAHGQPGQQFDWERVFGHYSATVDNPGCCVWRELIAAYPDARVLLTVHPKGAEAWYDSMVETIYAFERTWQYRLLKCFLPGMRKFSEMADKLIWQRSHRGTMGDRAAAIAHYHQHIADVKAAVPADRLLVFSARDGWGPLCAFLQRPVPDAPFPNVNDRKAIKMKFHAVVVGATLTLLILATLIGGGVYALVQALA